MMEACLTQIMESVQGEGILAGTRQIFLRFQGCNLRCSYCDTEATLRAAESCLHLNETGRWDRQIKLPNPLSSEQILDCIRGYKARWVSLTGGEPLLWADFIMILGEMLKNRYRVMLETNGTLYEEMEQCLQLVDLTSIDFKMPSAVGEDYFPLHKKFLHVARNKPCYVKIVLTASTTREEILQSCHLIREAGAHIPLILQPVTERFDVPALPLQQQLFYQELALDLLEDVRLLPQIHILMGLP